MPRQTTRRILKKKQRQTKKKIKRHTTDSQKTATTPKNNAQQPNLQNALGLSFARQQYGNPDLAIQQLRNQTQSYNDQIYNYNRTISSLQKEKSELEKQAKAAKKKIKEADRNLESTKIDFEIAEDKAKNIENIQKQIDLYNNKSHELQVQLIDLSAQPGLNDLRKQYYSADAEVKQKQLESKHMQMQIENNKLAEEVREKQQELTMIKTKNQAAFEFIQSKSFTHPEEELKNVLSEYMKEEEMQSLIQASENLRKQTEELFDKLKNNPNDHEAIQNQLKETIGKQSTHIAGLQRLNDRLEGKIAEIRHIRQTEIDFKNKAFDLEIKNKELNAQLHAPDSSKEKTNTKKRVETAVEKLGKLQAQNEQLKEEAETQQEINKQKRQQAELKAQIEALRNMPNDPEFQQQHEQLVNLKRDLEIKQETNKQLEQIKNDTKQLYKTKVSNEAKASAAAQMYNGCSSNESDEFVLTQQVDAKLNQEIENENNQTINIENTDECKRLLAQISEYQPRFDPNYGYWRALYNNDYPRLKDGTNILDIDDPRELAPIVNKYLAQIKSNYNNNNNKNIPVFTPNNDSGNFFDDDEEGN